MTAVPSPVGETRKVLIIDDDLHVRAAMSYALAQAGFDVIEARDGVEGLIRLRSEHPDMVFCDLEMPRMNGAEFCRAPDVQIARIPVVLVSGSSHVQSIAKELGVPYLHKPFRFDDLVQAIETHAKI